jgi:hypothetical protein
VGAGRGATINLPLPGNAGEPPVLLGVDRRCDECDCQVWLCTGVLPHCKTVLLVNQRCSVLLFNALMQGMRPNCWCLTPSWPQLLAASGQTSSWCQRGECYRMGLLAAGCCAVLRCAALCCCVFRPLCIQTFTRHLPPAGMMRTGKTRWQVGGPYLCANCLL